MADFCLALLWQPCTFSCFTDDIADQYLTYQTLYRLILEATCPSSDWSGTRICVSWAEDTSWTYSWLEHLCSRCRGGRYLTLCWEGSLSLAWKLPKAKKRWVVGHICMQVYFEELWDYSWYPLPIFSWGLVLIFNLASWGGSRNLKKAGDGQSWV